MRSGSSALLVILHGRNFSDPARPGTLSRAAEVCFEQGITSHRVTGVTVRVTLARIGVVKSSG